MDHCLTHCEALSMVHALKDFFPKHLTVSDEIVREAFHSFDKVEVIVVNSIVATKEQKVTDFSK